MDATSLTLVLGSAGALGLGGSLHCGLMCGPLACAAGGAAQGRERWVAHAAWNLARVLAYGATGALLGAMGRTALGGLRVHVHPVLPWVMVAGLVLTAFPLATALPRFPGGARIARALAVLGAKFSPVGRAALLGAATPFLPCGLLYGAFIAALGAGSAALGAMWMLTFALASMPALGLAQASFAAWRRWKLSPWILRATPLLAAGVVVWRALHVSAPSCH